MASLIHEKNRKRKPWRVDYTERGNRRTQRFATKTLAEAFIGEVASGRRQADRARLTLEKWLQRWVVEHGMEWEPRTRRDRARYADKWIVPGIGKMRLRDIGRAEVRSWRAEMVGRKGATPYVANTAVRILSAALGDAVDDELILANPCRGLTPLKVAGKNRREPATLAEVEGIRLMLTEPRDRALVSLMAYAGLRPAEARALRWSDVRDGSLTVQAALAEGGREKGTKTDRNRVVPIIEALAEDLAQVERVDRTVVGRIDHDNWAARVWRPARRKIDSDKTPYSLRHTFASLLIAEGRSVHEVARLLGHSSPALTLSTYGHLFDEAQLSEHESMAQAVTRARHEAISASASARPTEPEGL